MIARAIAISLFLTVSFSQTASAKPIYLSCDLGDKGNSFSVSVTLDEDLALATVVIVNTGFTERLAAAFTVDQVTFRNAQMRYSIDRVSMEITRFVPLLQQTTKGKCALQKVEKRAF